MKRNKNTNGSNKQDKVNEKDKDKDKEKEKDDSSLKRTSSFSDYDTDTAKKEEDGNNESQPAITVKKEPITLKKVISRSITASFLAMLYLSIVWSGHFYCILAVILSQTELYREIVNVRYVEARQRAMPWFRTLQWGWFIIGMVFVCESSLSLYHH